MSAKLRALWQQTAPDSMITNDDGWIISTRISPVDLGALNHLMRYMEGRTLCDKVGRPYARVCVDLMSRVRGPPGRQVIHHVYKEVPCAWFDKATRVYSGISKMAAVPPPQVAAHLEHELVANTPRYMMGKSLFDMQSRLYRIVGRSFGIPATLGAPIRVQAHLVMEVDIVNAQNQLLLSDFILEHGSAHATTALPTEFLDYVYQRDATMEKTMQLFAQVAVRKSYRVGFIGRHV